MELDFEIPVTAVPVIVEAVAVTASWILCWKMFRKTAIWVGARSSFELDRRLRELPELMELLELLDLRDRLDRLLERLRLFERDRFRDSFRDRLLERARERECWFRRDDGIKRNFVWFEASGCVLGALICAECCFTWLKLLQNLWQPLFRYQHWSS